MAFLGAIPSELHDRLRVKQELQAGWVEVTVVPNIVTRTACCSVGVALPVHSTFKAIEKKDHKEQEKWLLYWAVYGLFSLVEIYTDRLISWVPWYHQLKFTFLVWLQLPSIEGSRHLYERYLRSFLMKHQVRMNQSVGFIYSEMIEFVNSHQHKIDILKTLLQRSVFAVYNTLRGAILLAREHHHPPAIKDEESDDDESAT